jgi:hypothetical protein
MDPTHFEYETGLLNFQTGLVVAQWLDLFSRINPIPILVEKPANMIMRLYGFPLSLPFYERDIRIKSASHVFGVSEYP